MPTLRASKSNEPELRLRHTQGFTAAQLSTEPVGKILAEEPAAGGIDIGKLLTLLPILRKCIYKTFHISRVPASGSKQGE